MKNRKEKYGTSNVVKFSYTNQEYASFYEKHKMLCDEMSGIKPRIIKTHNSQTEIIITKEVFILAIKRLEAFIINYSHDFDDKTKQKEVFSDIAELEGDYNSDSLYNSFCTKIKNKQNLSMQERINFNILYFSYLFRAFELLVKVGTYLQSSMMIGTINIKKLIEWYDTKPFFDNLTNYRDEVSNSLSNFSIYDIIDQYKKILGYHYTYRLLVDYKELNAVDYLIRICNQYIFNYDFMLFVEKSAQNKKITDEVKKQSGFLKKILSTIYRLTNESLSNKNILPKINKKVLFDKTGI